VKIDHIETLLSCGDYAASDDWKATRERIHEAVKAVDWPVDAGTFTINPVVQANGVKPIKRVFVERLKAQGWTTEAPIKLTAATQSENLDLQPGNLDFMLTTEFGPIAIEWETGNVSSCHRSMNKLALGLTQGVIAAGIMIVPSRKLYKFLTDRIGNYGELRPYLPYWRALQCKSGIFEIVSFEHDAESTAAPLIPKGTDGNAPKKAKPPKPDQ
jgi:hypothetical protein